MTFCKKCRRLLVFCLYSLRGLGVALSLLITLITVAIAIVAFWLLLHLLPRKSWRKCAMQLLRRAPVIWMDINAAILWFSCANKWEVKGEYAALEKDSNYLLIANHLAWQDILVLGHVFNHKIPSLKFFMKKELLWTLPIAGLACKVLGYPFLQRHKRSQIRKNPQLKNQDIETTQAACREFMTQQVTIAFFPEGTRFTPLKHRSQQPTYQHLLKPKATGIALILQTMQKNLAGIIDVTLSYQPQISLWHFVCGNFQKIKVNFRLIPITDDLIGVAHQDRVFRKYFQNWLHEIWQQKDQSICQSSA